MRGVLFNLLEEVVTDERGLGAWDDVLDGLGLDGAYTSVGTYDDGEFMAVLRGVPTDACPMAAAGALVGASAVRGPAAAPDRPDADLLRWFGRGAMPLLAGRYPAFFDAHEDPLDMLATVESVIHCEVRTLDPRADVPTFGVEHHAGHGRRALVLHYRSARQLCMLAEGFVLGVGDHYGSDVAVSQLLCMHRGDASCRLVVTHR